MQPSSEDASTKPADPGYAAKEAAAAFVAPFWHATNTAEESDVNMVLKRTHVEVMGQRVMVPYLVNNKIIKEGTYFKFFRPAETAKAKAKVAKK